MEKFVEAVVNALLIIGVVGGATFVVNSAETHPERRTAAYVAMGLVLLGVAFNDFLTFSVAFLPEETQSDMLNGETLNQNDAMAGFAVSVIGLILSAAFFLRPFREWVARFFPKPQPDYRAPLMTLEDGEIAVQMGQDPPQNRYELRGFRPDSLMHAWAAILSLQFGAAQLSAFFAQGGLSGVAEDIGVTYVSLVSQMMIFVIIPLLGVGIFMRRDAQASLERLGLKGIGFIDIGAAVGTTFALLTMVFVVGIAWQLMVSEETFEAQTEASGALSASVTTIGLAFALAATAAIGEEIAFRGALQPIFGLWPTSIFFVLVHTQYTLTPAVLIIAVVTIVFAYTRRYLSTTTAILGHFLYNFLSLLFSLAASELQDTVESIILGLL